MTYRIRGLEPDQFTRMQSASDDALAAAGVIRHIATSKPGFPCRVTLEDAEPDEELLLFNFTSHDVDTPYRTAYAIYVRRGASRAAEYVDEIPPVFQGRTLALRGFGNDGMLKTAALALPGEADAAIRSMLANRQIGYIDVHNAAYGCFAARVERSDP